MNVHSRPRKTSTRRVAQGAEIAPAVSLSRPWRCRVCAVRYRVLRLMPRCSATWVMCQRLAPVHCQQCIAFGVLEAYVGGEVRVQGRACPRGQRPTGQRPKPCRRHRVASPLHTTSGEQIWDSTRPSSHNAASVRSIAHLPHVARPGEIEQRLRAPQAQVTTACLRPPGPARSSNCPLSLRSRSAGNATSRPLRR
jgi:hypothetical protein